MFDFRVMHRSALLAKQPVSSSGIRLQALAEGYVVQVLENPGCGDITAFLGKLTNSAAYAVRPAAPGQWFLIGKETMPQEQMTTLLKALSPHAAGVDQSHGRIRIGIEGPMVERVLAKGTGVDIDLAAFAVGHATTTLIGHISAHITRVGEQAFEIMVLRGFAESLWDDLVQMSGEFN